MGNWEYLVVPLDEAGGVKKQVDLGVSDRPVA